MVAKQKPARFAIYWVNLDPTIGAEAKKTRPCIIVSPDSLNKGLNTVIVAPMTSTIKNWPFRVNITHKGKEGQIMLDQLRVISKERLFKTDGLITDKYLQQQITAILTEMFTL